MDAILTGDALSYWLILHHCNNVANPEKFIVCKEIIEIVTRNLFLDNMTKSDHCITENIFRQFSISH